MFEGVTSKRLESGHEGHKNYMWSKEFIALGDKKRIGIVEIYRIIKCKGFNCYPLQIPIITFRSPNNSIPYEKCQVIIQCLIKEASDCLGGEMSFTLMSWVEENLQKVIKDPYQFETMELGKNWGTKNDEQPENKTDEVKEEKKEELVTNKKKYAKPKKQKLFDMLFAIKKEKPLKFNHEINQYLLQELRRKTKTNSKYQQYQRLRQALPAFNSRDEIIELMTKNQVLVISGETGCGKSTQIPQFVLDHYINTKRGSVCNIIVTQPRRISAVGLAERVASERCEGVGETVGYSIRLENRISEATQLLYCTTGILLRRLMTSLKIQSVSHVIIDEVHERSVDIDFLLVILKFLIEKRSDLKLILMSATLNAKLFSEYFNNCPVLQIPGRTYPVKTFFLEDLLSESRICLPKTRWSKILPQEQRLRAKNLKEKEVYKNHKLGITYGDRVFHQLSKWDEREHHQVEVQLIVDCIFHICKTYPLPTKYENDDYDDGTHKSYRTRPKPKPKENKQDRSSIDTQQAILVFLPGMWEISKTEELFKEQIELKQMNIKQFWIIPLHSSLPTINQKRVFATPPPGVRKIVLSTNIAETSITINDCKYVIDTGKMRQMSFDPTKEISVLQETWVSTAHAEQRKGRAGRVGPGYCYKLYSMDKQYNDMKPSPIPELLRSSLEGVALRIKLLLTLSNSKKWLKDKKAQQKGDKGGIKSVLTACIEPPPKELIEAAVNGLKEVGALDNKELLTPLGFHLAKLPVGNVRLGKMLIFAVIFSCLTPVLVIAAILTGKPIYRASKDRREIADKIKKKYYVSKSDHITMFKFYKGWKRAMCLYGTQSAKKFAWDNCLSHIALEQIDGIAKQYKNALREINFIDNTYNFESGIIQNECDHFLNKNSKSNKLIKGILCAGLYPNIIKVKMPKKKYDKTLTGADERDADAAAIKFLLHPKYNTISEEKRNENLEKNVRWTNGRIFLHGSSCLYQEKVYECGWLIYLTKIETRKLQVYDASMVTAYSLLFFGGKMNVDHLRGHIVIDNWIRFIAPGRIAVLVSELKKMCDYWLMKKIADPTLDISQSGVILAIERLLKSDGLE